VFWNCSIWPEEFANNAVISFSYSNDKALLAYFFSVLVDAESRLRQAIALFSDDFAH
jgi:hypothetical protein